MNRILKITTVLLRAKTCLALATISCIVVVLLSACHHPGEKFQSQIDSLRTQLQSVSLKFQKLDTAKINACQKSIFSDIQWIEENFNDTMEKEEALEITRYAEIAREIKKLKNKQKEQLVELLFSKNQVIALQTDVKNNLVTTDSLPEYISNEEKAIKILGESANRIYAWSEKIIENCKTKRDQISKIIGKLEKEDKRNHE